MSDRKDSSKEERARSLNNVSDLSNSRNACVRRVFLKHASATAIVASVIPAKSVWANGITTSIVASGHGSDWAGGNAIKLLSPGSWKQRLDPDDNNGNRGTHKNEADVSFATVFGGNPIEHDGGGVFSTDNTLYRVLNGTNPQGDKDNTWKGPGDVNFHIIAMYLNAKYTGTLGLSYPVVNAQTSRPFSSLTAYADKLYELAQTNPSIVGGQLKTLISNNHV